MPSYVWKPIEFPEPWEALVVQEMSYLKKVWEDQKKNLQKKEVYDKFIQEMKRSWAIETGIIERLYDLNEGATQLLVQQGLHASLIQHGDSNKNPEELIVVLQDHVTSLDFVMDLIGGARRLSVSWIKELHSLLTKNQNYTTAVDQFGRFQEISLIKGDFKKTPNNPKTKDGFLHEYCPPEQVASQMDELVKIYHGLPEIHPEVRSAWIHHAFNQIHPFQDGNGRVARALASIDFIKAGLFPLIVHRTQREEYLQALVHADQGDLSLLVKMFYRLQEDSFRRAISQSEQILQKVKTKESILLAFQDKVRDRQEKYGNPIQRRLLQHMEIFKKESAAYMIDYIKDFKDLQKFRPAIQFKVVQNTPTTHHYYKQQILWIAHQKDYWVDLHPPRSWVKLEIRNGGKSEIVVVFHCIGGQDSGTGVAVAFLDHRDEGERLGDRPPDDILVEPLLVLADSDPAIQSKKLKEWLESVMLYGLSAAIRYL